MISALAWVPRGASREYPIRYELSEDEVKMVLKANKDDKEQQKDDDDDDIDNEDDIEQQGAIIDISTLPSELNMEGYDNDDVMESESVDGMDEDGNEAYAANESENIMDGGEDVTVSWLTLVVMY